MNALDIAAVLTLNSTQYDAGLAKAKGSAEGFGTKASKIAGGVVKAFGAMGVAAGAFAALSVKTGAEFDKSMSQVAATLGVTMEEMENTVGETDTQFGHFSGTLRDFAMYMGKNTAFSATQASEALNYMALAGYDAQTSMNMLPNVLNLAAAGNMELASASDMVTDAQSALGLSLEDTTKMVDQMAKASSKSNTSVQQLGSAILTVGGTAKSLKGGTVELATALGILADNGTKGAEGGTALRNVLMALSGKKFENTFGAMGISAYDAEGNMRSLKDVFQDMNKAMEGMSTEEKTKLIQKTFNARDLKNVNALLATTTDRWDELSGAIGDADGAAAQMADTQLDNLAGDVTLFKSALEGVQILISDKLSGSLRTLVQTATKGLGVINGILEGDSVNSISTFAESLVKTFGSMLPSLVQTATDTGVQFITNLGNGLVEGIPNLLGQVLPAIASFSEQLRGNAGSLVDAGIGMILNLAKGIANSLPVLITYIPQIVTNIAGIINDNAPKLIAAAFNLIVILGKGLIDAIPTLVANIPQIIQAIVSVFFAFSWGALGKNVVKGIGNGIKSMAGAIKSQAGTIAKNAMNALKGGFSYARSLGANAIKAVINGIRSMFSSIASAGRGLASKAVSAIKNGFTGMRDIGMNIVKGIWNGISNGAGWIKSQIAGWVGNVKNFIKNLFGIHSPSTWARDVIGLNIAKGLAEGIEDGESLVDSSLSELVNVPDVDLGVNTARPNADLFGMMKQVQMTNNITVDGAENPEDFASRFVRQLQMEMRMA